MRVLLIRWFDWWARVAGRRVTSRRPATPFPSSPASRRETRIEPPVEKRAAKSHAEEKPEARDEADTQSLLETLQLHSLDASVAARPVDAAVRQRTLTGLDNLQQIPALQSLAQGFLDALNQPEVEIEKIVETIEKDSALSVRVLRLANSVMISPEQRIEDLESAVQMLGVLRVRKAAQALFTLRGANQVAEGFDWRHLWVHALATAAIAEELERHFRAGQESKIYLAALLHDVGKIVLSTLAPDDYRALLVSAWCDRGRLENLERERLGVDHREAGVVFARTNGLPVIVVEAIAHHDRPENAEHHAFEVALVALANYLSKAHGLGFSGSRLDPSDGDFDTLSAWNVVAAELGARPNADALEKELQPFIANLRGEMRSLREGL